MSTTSRCIDGASRYFAVAHLEVPARDDLMFAHELADNIEREIKTDTGIQLTLHIDPIDNEDEDARSRNARCERVLKTLGEEYSLHDFRIVPRRSHTNVIFDVEMPFESRRLCGRRDK